MTVTSSVTFSSAAKTAALKSSNCSASIMKALGDLRVSVTDCFADYYGCGSFGFIIYFDKLLFKLVPFLFVLFPFVFDFHADKMQPRHDLVTQLFQLPG